VGMIMVHSNGIQKLKMYMCHLEQRVMQCLRLIIIYSYAVVRLGHFFNNHNVCAIVIAKFPRYNLERVYQSDAPIFKKS
ncbi:MAG: hypothetical protein CVT90_02335, partial [Candidatus Altiarchaeales archaeon HGW-Altiarchaeales-3]